MKQLLIEGNPVDIVTYKDAIKHKKDPKYVNYIWAFCMCEIICAILKIKIPDLSIIEYPIYISNKQNEIDILHGFTRTRINYPRLANNHIVLSMYASSELQIIGTMGHELRHIWQAKYKPDLNSSPARGINEALTHPSEVDADGFAIWLVSDFYEMTIDKAAKNYCFSELILSQDAFNLRLEKAKEIQKVLTKVKVK